MAWSPDGRRVAAVTIDGGVRVWNVSTGKLLVEQFHQRQLLTVEWSADSKALFTVSGWGKKALYWHFGALK